MGEQLSGDGRFPTLGSELEPLFASPVLVVAINGGESVDDDEAGVAGDVELAVLGSVVFFKNRTVGVWMG